MHKNTVEISASRLRSDIDICPSEIINSVAHSGSDDVNIINMRKLCCCDRAVTGAWSESLLYQ